MPPRIRSFLPRPPFARKKKAPAAEAPRVFREFVETLQRLDMNSPGKDKGGGGPRSRARRRAYRGNGHKRPSQPGRVKA